MLVLSIHQLLNCCLNSSKCCLKNRTNCILAKEKHGAYLQKVKCHLQAQVTGMIHVMKLEEEWILVPKWEGLETHGRYCSLGRHHVGLFVRVEA